MKYICKVAYKVWKITRWIVSSIILVFFVSYAANLAVVQGNVHTTFLVSIVDRLVLPGLYRTLTLSTLAVVFSIALSSWLITKIDACNDPDSTKEQTGGEDRHSRLLLDSNRPVAQWNGFDAPIPEVLWSPDGMSLASIGSQGIVHIWQGKDFSLKAELHPSSESVDWLRYLAWSPDSQFLIVAGEDKCARIWNVLDGTVQKILQHSASPLSLGWTSRGIDIVTEDGWIAFLPSPITTMLTTWQTVLLAVGPLQAAAWSWHSDILAIVSVTGKLRIEDFRSHSREQGRDIEQTQVIKWDPMDTYLALGGKNGAIQIWRWKTKLVKKLKKLSEWTTGHQELRALCWMPKGHFLVSGDSGGSVKIWHIPEGQLHQEFDTHNGPITSLSISPQAMSLCSAHENGTLAIWKIQKKM